MPCAAEISNAESLVGPPNIADNFLPMRVVPLQHLATTPDQLANLMQRYKHSNYMLAYQPAEHVPWWHMDRYWHPYRAVPHIAVSLSDTASAEDILAAVLEAGYLRQHMRMAMGVATRSRRHKHEGEGVGVHETQGKYA